MTPQREEEGAAATVTGRSWASYYTGCHCTVLTISYVSNRFFLKQRVQLGNSRRAYKQLYRGRKRRKSYSFEVIWGPEELFEC